jgi:hypothetical protein
VCYCAVLLRLRGAGRLVLVCSCSCLFAFAAVLVLGAVFTWHHSHPHSPQSCNNVHNKVSRHIYTARCRHEAFWSGLTCQRRRALVQPKQAFAEGLRFPVE